MDQIISAAEANRRFSQILREVREGVTFSVTNHGRKVARIVPVAMDEREAEALRAREELFERLERQRAKNAPPWTRDELYD